MIAQDVVEAELSRLDSLSSADLKCMYVELIGPLPKYLRRGFLTIATGHALQERALGGLDRATQRELDRLVAAVTPVGARPRPAPNRRLKPGTRLVRQWNGAMHEVVVTATGFSWNGAEHRSLSVIARAISGTRWNGWVFFGIKRPAKAAGTSSAAMRSAGTPPQRCSAAEVAYG